MSSLGKSETRCVVVGGGPAGIILGFLLARAGIPVTVLEKHGDFLRDFRGDTIHPSTLELMHELGLLEEFLQAPHQEVPKLGGVINGHNVPIADFSRLPTRCKFIAFMPQWDFLNFFARHAKRFSAFQLCMEHEVLDLVFDGDRVAGVRAKTPNGELEAHADLVVGCDGRSSIVRERAGFEVCEFGVPLLAVRLCDSKRRVRADQSARIVDLSRRACPDGGFSARPRRRAGRLVENQTAHRAD
jgi:2-polyprenyl-6-methoxyphenol hydroxylase-like FAD-dependent oxidoreductase